MAYKDFISGLQKKLEEKKQELGYNKMAFFEDGATSTDAKELSIIRETNIKYHKTESDVLIGDYIILYQYEGKREQICRFDCGQLYREYEKGSWTAVWDRGRSVGECDGQYIPHGAAAYVLKADGYIKSTLSQRRVYGVEQ